MLAANRKNVTMGPAPEKSHGIAGKKKVETLKDNFSLTGEAFKHYKENVSIPQDYCPQKRATQAPEQKPAYGNWC